MLKSIWVRLRQPPKVNRSDIVVVLTLGVLWVGAVFSRPYTIRMDCVVPGDCPTDAIPWIDRSISDGKRNPRANYWSDVTQNSAGYLALGAPAVFHGTLVALGRVHPGAAAAAFGADFLILLQATFINGLTNEVVRMGVQRPRPFVYRDIKKEGRNPAHYTSFYSGHTSFAAVATLSLFLIFLSRGAPGWAQGISLAAWVGLTLSTGILRVLAGVHFLTDVVVGAIAGSVIAIAVALLHRERKNSNLHA